MDHFTLLYPNPHSADRNECGSMRIRIHNTEIKSVCLAFLPLYYYFFCLEEYQAQFWKLTATNNELLKQLAEKARFFYNSITYCRLARPQLPFFLFKSVFIPEMDCISCMGLELIYHFFRRTSLRIIIYWNRNFWTWIWSTKVPSCSWVSEDSWSFRKNTKLIFLFSLRQNTTFTIPRDLLPNKAPDFTL